MSGTTKDVALARRLSPSLALAMLGAAVSAAACGQSMFPAFTGGSGKGAGGLDQAGGVAGAAGGGGIKPSGSGGDSSSGGGGGLASSGTGGGAPGTGGTASGGRNGGTGGAATGNGGANMGTGSGTGGQGGAGSVVTVTVSVVGGPGGTSITPTSPTAGSSCVAGRCTIPVGGSVMATSPALTDWAFDGWSVNGLAYTKETTYQMLNLDRDVALTATFINQRMETCRDLTPENAMTTTRPLVMTTYSTAGGWSTPATCPWMCMTGFCTAGASCLDPYVDAIALTGDAYAIVWYGGDDRPGMSRSVGTGQSVTPSTAVTMARFGLYFRDRFAFDSGNLATSPIILELDRRDANGTIQATYTTMVDPQFKGGWVFWDTPATTLNQGVVYIFTSFMTNAFTLPVDSGVEWAKAAYAGGAAYTAQVTSGDLKAWSSWPAADTDGRDLLFRLQKTNPACK